MDNPDSSNDFYTISPGAKKSSKRSPFLILVIIMALGILGFGAYTFLGVGKNKKAEVTPTPTALPTPTETPTPTPEVSTTPGKKASPTPTKPTTTPSKSTSETTDKASGIDRSAITVEVLNGSGTAGVANKAKTTLEGLGYKVGSTGNAESFDFDKTMIEVKSGKTSLLTLLKKDLATNYVVGTASATLPSSSSIDARVTVGKQ